jgi:hypothetical protein
MSKRSEGVIDALQAGIDRANAERPGATDRLVFLLIVADPDDDTISLACSGGDHLAFDILRDIVEQDDEERKKRDGAWPNWGDSPNGFDGPQGAN